MPKVGGLKGLTGTFEIWLNLVEDPESILFPRWTPAGFNFSHSINRKRAYAIISATGKFPHWARAVCETIYGRKVFLNDAWKLKQFMGLKRLDSTAAYVSGSWEENERNVYRL